MSVGREAKMTLLTPYVFAPAHMVISSVAFEGYKALIGVKRAFPLMQQQGVRQGFEQLTVYCQQFEDRCDGSCGRFCSWESLMLHSVSTGLDSVDTESKGFLIMLLTLHSVCYATFPI